MTQERIDIEVTDKVSEVPAKKLREIASAATQADTAIDRLKASMAQLDGSALTRMSTASAKLTDAHAREVSATARLENARARLSGANDRAAIQEQRLATATAQAEAAQQRAATATAQAAGAAARAEAASMRLAAAKRREAAATVAATGATVTNTAAQTANAASTALTNHQLQNLTYQLNDVGVSLASGQSPFMVMLQQGSQISTVFGPGTGVTGILRGLGQAVFSIARTFAPVLVVVGVAAASFGILTNEINKTTGVGVVMGDTIKASLQLIGEAVYNFVQPAIDTIAPYFRAAYNLVIDYTRMVINRIARGAAAIPILFKAPLSTLPDLFAYWATRAVARMLSIIADGLFDVGSLLENVPGLGAAFTGAAVAATELGNKTRFAAEDIQSDMSAAAKSVNDELTAVFNKDYAGAAFDAIRERSIELAKERIASENDEASATGGAAASLSRKAEILQEIRAPLTEYLTDQRALVELLREGSITAGQFNQALSALALVKSLQDVDSSLVGTPFADSAAMDEIREAEQERLNIVQFALEARIIAEEEAVARIVAINRQAAADIQAIETSRQTMMIASASDTFGTLSEAARTYAGEQSGIYKALFAVSKGFAVAEAIVKTQQGVATALASGPPPLNFISAGLVAAKGAATVATITAQGFADGGRVVGPGGPRTDSIPAMLSDGEFVVNAAATARNLPFLEAMNNNRAPTRQYADGGRVQASAYSAQVPRVGTAPQLTLNSSPNINVYTSDPNTRVEMTTSQVDAMAARRVNRGQRNL